MKKLSKVLALTLTIAMIIGATLVTGVVSVSADDVVVWEGDINMDFETKNTVAIINSDDSLTQAIRDDLAINGVASKYVLTSSDSKFVSGGSGYTTWGFYDELTAATPDNYHEWWSDKGSDMTSATWSDAADLALMGLKVNLCLYSDGTGDVGHVGHIKLVATHAAGASQVTTQAPRPVVDPEEVISKGQVVWTGTLDQDYTTTNTMAMLKVDEMNDAIRNDIAANGPAKAYAVVADAAYVSGDSGYASYCFYQETPDYLEAWADKGSGVTTAIWTEPSLLAQMGNKVQLALCCDTDGDVIHVNTLTIYVVRDGSFTVPSQSQTQPSASETQPSASESQQQTEPSETEPTQPSQAVLAGDANSDGVINMKDVLTLRKLLADIAVEINEAAADFNGDGAINMKDVLGLRKEIAK